MPAERRLQQGSVSALLLLLAALPAAAQTAAPDPAAPAAMPPADAAIRLPQLDVSGAAPPASDGYQPLRSSSATRTDTPLRDIPQSVNVVTQQAIRDLSMQNLQDVMRYVPGAGFAQGEGNRDTPVLRGQSTTASLYVDGIRDDVQYYRDLYNIDRVEVLLGPSALMFGRGGAGGVINRVTRQADWNQVREVRLQAGSFGDWRGTFDVGQGITEQLAFRMMGLYEAADSYRNGVHYRRSGINPTFAFRPDNNTLFRISYENYRDERTADRGIPSFGGRPLATGVSTFFGDPNNSNAHANVNAVNFSGERTFENGLLLRNQFRFATYDKMYQNIFPGAVNSTATSVAIQAYNNATRRDNYINQTDLIYSFNPGPIGHKVLGGMELSRQVTENLRLTGFFTSVGPNATVFNTPLGLSRINVPVSFRPNATDANNSGTADSFALYLQDQIQLLPQLQLLLGLRYENFNVDFTNNRTGDRFNNSDSTFSPRVGLVYRPVDPLSLYFAYSNSSLPRAGEQLASLTLSTANLKPEEFTNYEVGAKWDVNPALTLTAALFQLERTNVAVTDPANVARSILIDGTRTRGFELGLRGRVTSAWSILAGYAYTEGETTAAQSATIPKGNTVPFLARNAVSLWNRYDFTDRIGAGIGMIHQSSYFASIDNQVRIPGFTRFDAAAFFKVTDRIFAQLNVENLFGVRYYPVADNNNNITPGAPVSVRFALTSQF
jgi:catecholate siderophore receptor